MKKDKKMEQILKVLELRLKTLEAEMMREQNTKRDLRRSQVENIEKRNRVIEAFDGVAQISPVEYRWRHVQLQKLSLDQKGLQPELARAALRRGDVQNRMRALLRQRLVIAVILEKSRETNGQSEEEQTMTLMQLAKMRQLTS